MERERNSAMVPDVGGRYLERIWTQSRIAVVHRPRKGHLKVRLPFAKGNRGWMKPSSRHKEPEWVSNVKHSYWSVPHGWFDRLIRQILMRYEQVYVISPYNMREVCAPACMRAHGVHCECSCLGVNHGAGVDSSWYVISETCAVRWKGESLAIKLVKRKT